MDTKSNAPNQTKVAVYARVSTDTQELEHQLSSCERWCQYKELKICGVYKDVGSGKEYRNRPEFLRLRDDLRKGEYDGLVVFRLDRLFRNVVEAVNFIQEWENRGIRLYSINENLDSSTAIGRAMRDIILVLAALERENISEATKARLSTLRADGIRLGRPPTKTQWIEKVALLRSQGKSIRAIAEELNLKTATVGKYAKITKQ
jgi:DNA invertase Pin-like site-specific DNA recombinase